MSMRQAQNQEAVYDERVNATIRGLLEGKSREDLAEEFGLSTWKSLDIYMRRKGFTWIGESNTYIPAITKIDKVIEEVASSVPVKAQQVIRKFEMYGKESDPRAIAKEIGFDTHREMADYMEEKDLTWDSELGNYVMGYCKQPSNSTKEISKESISNNVVKMPSRQSVAQTGSQTENELLFQYLPLLQTIWENKDRLLDLLMPSSEGHIPKYAVPGIPKTKSIYMSELLARIVTEYSDSKNLSQREIVEAALIEYLKRYGYQNEVEKLLRKK